MRIINCIIIFVFLPLSLIAGDSARSELISRIPFRIFSGGVIIVKAAIPPSQDSLTFIVDTGSGGISLDSVTCNSLGIVSRETDTLINGIGGTRRVHFVFNKTLAFPGLDVKGLNFHINNYDVLTSVYGEQIDGIIGFSFFSRYIVEIDYDSMLLRVFKPGVHEYPENGHFLKPKFSTIPFQAARVKDRHAVNFNFIFDTGAGLCFLMNERFAADSSILLSRRKPQTTQAEGMLGKVHMRLTVVKELKIGPYRFRQVPTYLYLDDYNVTSYPFSGGLIGNELLRRFNVVLNYPGKEIHLTPNKFFNEPFDYTYTGLGIYYSDGKIMVEDVINNSPAYKAGIRIGDQVIGVGNNLSNNIQQYKNMLQVPNQRIRLIISRNGKLYPVMMKTVSILSRNSF